MRRIDVRTRIQGTDRQIYVPNYDGGVDVYKLISN